VPLPYPPPIPETLAAPFERLLPWIRSHFPQIESLRNGTRRIYLDNAAGTLVPRAVAEAMAEAALWSNPQPGRSWPSGPRTLNEQRRVREQLAAFLNAPTDTPIYLAESTTASLYKLREGLEPEWEAGHNVVVTDCDHFANISPWEWRARWEVRRARMLPDGGLDLDHFAAQLDANTRLVAVTLASNGLGNLLPVEEVVRLARERSPEAVVVVDAVHGAPHVPIDLTALGADALAFSTYKLFGPNCGVLWLSSGLAARLSPFHVEPHTDAETLLEWGTLSNAAVGGIAAALEYLERLGERLEPVAVGQLSEYPRDRRRYKLTLTAARAYEAKLSGQVLSGLAEMENVRVLGLSALEATASRVPTISFDVEGYTPEELERHLWQLGTVQAAAGSHYSGAVLRGLELPSVFRASFAHYNTPQEAEGLLNAIRNLPAPGGI
jgi:selenocysteine lyase/cysteine desulfurase